MGKVLIGMGLALVVAGLLFMAFERGAAAGIRLPGDFEFGGRNWRVSVPLATSILISLVLTVLLNLAFWLMRRR